MIKFPDIARCPIVAVDVETTGLNWRTDSVFGVALSLLDGDDYYWDIRKNPQVIDWLRNELPKVKKLVNHNAKFDSHMLRHSLGVNIDNNLFECTMIRSALINEHLMSYSLDDLGEKYLKERKVSSIYQELSDIFGGKATRNVQMKNLHKAPESLVAPYAKQDTRLAIKLWLWQESEIDKQDLHQVWKFEQRLFPHIIKMETRGIRVDVDRASEQIKKLTIRINDLKAQLNSLAGFTVNPNPSGSIYRLFEPKQDDDGTWISNDGTILSETPAGKPSIGAAALEKMTHPAAALILRCRKLLKCRDTFIKGCIIEGNYDGYVYPNINQTKGDDTGGTGTGRISYSNPNLQAIPARDREIALLVRPLFLPDEGQCWVYGDLDQHEFRIFTHYANSKPLIKAYQQDPYTDIHQKVADLTKLARSAEKSGGASAKQLNLAAVFNMGKGAIAEKMGLPWEWDSFVTRDGEIIIYKRPGEEALEIINKYHEMVPGVKDMADRASNIAKNRGYIITAMGRHIRFPGGKFTHKASGLVYQGSSADYNKSHIINICDYLESECVDGRLLLNIHDEFNLSMPSNDTSRKHILEMKKIIQDCPDLRVPIVLDFGDFGANWWAATQSKLITNGHEWTNNVKLIEGK